MRGPAIVAALVLAGGAAQGQTTAPATSFPQGSAPSPAAPPSSTPLPPAHDGVITPGMGSRVDPHMPVMHPRAPGRTPVIRPPHRSAGGGAVIDPR